MSDFTALIPDAQGFYARLNANNTRDWWLENKATYDNHLKAPALDLLERLTQPLSKLVDTPIKSKLFRPHRDVRFSKDKTPYNTHLHMMWQIESDARQNPVFFFGIGTDYVTAGGGIMGFDKPVLGDWRKMVDLDTKRIAGIIADAEEQGFKLRDPVLKRVPSPYDQDHPAGRLLRMKGVVASKNLNIKAPLQDQIMAAFTAIWPMNHLLLSIAEG